MKTAIAITVGDFNGIGPEIVLRAVRRAEIRDLCRPILVGPLQAFQYFSDRLHLPVRFTVCQPETAPGPQRKGHVSLVPSSELPPSAIRPGELSADAGLAAARALEVSVRLTQLGRAAAIVTAPVSKEALHLAGIPQPGQTEMLQKLTGSPVVAMMLVSKSLRVGLATIHLPLRDVPAALTRQLLEDRCGVIHAALQRDWKIAHPSLAVLGLNPHAGEQGYLGTEEMDVIRPALQRLRELRIRCEGPFPADAFFARYRPGLFDAVVAMYHDQGLIPLKMAGKGKSVNVTAGLPLVRTSPDHGTAFDKAGKGIADPASMIEAIRLAVTIARNRSR